MVAKISNLSKISVLYPLLLLLFVCTSYIHASSIPYPYRPSIYAGYIINAYNITEINASWIIQSSLLDYGGVSSQWIGIGGPLEPISSGDLIQIGTGYKPYFTPYISPLSPAWYECTTAVDCNASKGSGLNVGHAELIYKLAKEGDVINAEIKLINSTDNKWFIGMNDITEKWTYNKTVTYNSLRFGGDFFEELPLSCISIAGYNLFCNNRLSEFGFAEFGPDFTNYSLFVEKDGNSTPYILREYNISHGIEIAPVNFDIQDDYNSPILANPDPITPDGTSFGITYGGLRVANILKPLKIPLGSIVKLKGIISGKPWIGSYQWYKAGHNFSLTPLSFSSATTDTLQMPVTQNMIVVLFVKDNILNPNPTAYNYTYINVTPRSVPINLSNNQSAPTPAPFQQLIIVNSAEYYGINSDWDNVEFTAGANATGNVLPAWVESGATNTSSHTLVWVRLSNSIPAYGTNTIYMDIMPENVMSANGPTGEAPLLSLARGDEYGQYDNGNSVFSSYSNFSGNYSGGANEAINTIVQSGGNTHHPKVY